MTITSVTRCAILFGGLLLAAGAAQAQIPAVVRLLVGYPAGGPVDQGARMVAPYLSKELGTTVVVENRPGANGGIAGDTVAKGAPDSATLWFAASPTITISPNVMVNMPFDPATQLTPLAPVVSYYNVLVINKDLPFKTMKDLVDFAKANPGKVTYGSAGVGGSNHLSGELLAERTGAKLLHVPYKGNAPAITDTIAGQVQMVLSGVPALVPHIQSGRLRAIAIGSLKRFPALPGVPTFDESGLKGYEATTWFGLMAPAKTPKDIINRLNVEVAKILASADIKEHFMAEGLEPMGGTPEDFARFIGSEIDKYAKVIKAAGVQQQ